MQQQSLQTRTDRVKWLLADAVRRFSPVVFATGFGAEDMVLFDIVARGFPQIAIVTLDTGRLPQETYDLMHRAVRAYQREVEVYFPQAQAVEGYVRANGVNGFYDGIAQRKACCEARKVEPLKRALAGKKAWITGLRRSQSVTRQRLDEIAFDADNGLHKLSPLADWSEQDVWNYITARGVPYNALHDRGYPSLGCAPCTRAISAGEDVRAGRWWWESSEHKECGLHRQATPA